MGRFYAQTAAFLLCLSACAGRSGASGEAKSRMERGPGRPRRLTPELTWESANAAWVRRRSVRFSVEFELPSGREWDVDDASERWLVATHRATDSQLRIRVWPAERLVRPEDCKAQLVLWRPATPLRFDQELERRSVDAPAPFRTELAVGVKQGRKGALEGYILAFGAAVGRCYAAVFVTRAQGLDSRAVLARRLAVIGDGVIVRLRFFSIDDRVRGEVLR
jgi:hypothetical protein